MKQVKNCKTCGTEFVSSNGRKYCCDDCKQEALRQQWKEAEHRRKNGQQNQEFVKRCLVCGKEFSGTSRKIYCSASCRAKAKVGREKLYYPEWYSENKDHVIKKVIERRDQRIPEVKPAPQDKCMGGC